jgi:hypothetical protein
MRHDVLLNPQIDLGSQRSSVSLFDVFHQQDGWIDVGAVRNRDQAPVVCNPEHRTMWTDCLRFSMRRLHACVELNEGMIMVIRFEKKDRLMAEDVEGM